jgi:ATP-dependent Zn protease
MKMSEAAAKEFAKKIADVVKQAMQRKTAALEMRIQVLEAMVAELGKRN